MRVLAALLLASAAAAAAPAPQGVTLVFPSGAVLQGLLRSDDGTTVRMDADGGEVEFPREALAEVRLGPNAETEFQARQAVAGPKDARALWELSRWARENGLPGRSRALAERIVALDPEHVEARAALGYAREGGIWLTQDDRMRARGYVLFDGRWMTRAERRFALEREAREEERRAEALAEARRTDAVVLELARLGLLRGPEPAPSLGFIEVVGFGPLAVDERGRTRLLPRERMTGPGPWRPQPFRSFHAVLGRPVSDPFPQIGLDPLR